nr:MAG TPA: Protein of unknown function (DUF3307) [Bacteriophage sp.]
MRSGKKAAIQPSKNALLYLPKLLRGNDRKTWDYGVGRSKHETNEKAYHLFVHCVLYIVPFYVAFGWCWQLGAVFVSHMIVDALKARYYKISYCLDQVIHCAVLSVFLIWR